MHHDLDLKEVKKEWHGTLKAYLIGFILSLLLTIASFSLVTYEILSGSLIVYTVVGLALTQAIVQLIFFLHLGQESSPNWDKLIFYFMVLVLVIIVAGSLWIMRDLDNRVMADMQHEMTHD